MSRIYEDNSFAIGHTPLVKLNSITKNAKATVLAKIEGATLPIASNAELEQI